MVICNPWHFLAYTPITPISDSIFTWHSPCVSCFSSYKDISHIGLSAHSTPVWFHLNLTNYICNGPMSDKVTFWSSEKNMILGSTLLNPIQGCFQGKDGHSALLSFWLLGLPAFGSCRWTFYVSTSDGKLPGEGEMNFAMRTSTTMLVTQHPHASWVGWEPKVGQRRDFNALNF